MTVCNSKIGDKLLSLKHALGLTATARDLLLLEGPITTNLGKDFLPEIIEFMDTFLTAQEREDNQGVLKRWAARTRAGSYDLIFSALRWTHLDETVRAPLKCYWFSRESANLEDIRSWTREAENTVREERGIPRVGEGWAAESKLCSEIREALPMHQVLHHARPSWLGSQHLDIFVPELNVAVEYQGVQHDQPVEYFGGEEAFQETRRRDRRKKSLCTRNGVRLIHVRPGYKIDEVIADISKTG